MRELRNPESAVVESDGCFGPRPAERAGAGVEKPFDRGQFVVGGDVIGCAQQFWKPNEFGDVNAAVRECPTACGESDRSVPSRIAYCEQVVHVIERLRAPPVLAGLRDLLLFNELATPAIRSRIGERPRWTGYMLRADN